MSKHDTEVTLNQILLYVMEAVELSRGKIRQDLDRDRILNLALARLLEMLGEAANRIPQNVQDQ